MATTRILTPFEQQNVDYGFSPDVQPSSLSLRRAAPLPTPYKPLRVDQPRSREGIRGRAYSPVAATPASRPQGPEFRLGPRGVDHGPKDLGTVKNDYAQGGDGTVAREAAPAQRGVNVAGGLDRDELIRRMEIAATTMRGSPTARATVMGVYGDQVKALDQAELDKNKGNIESDQLAYRGNMDANMQESRGRQEFGNTMGVMIRKGEMDAETAAAAAEAQANDPYRKAQIENLRSQTEINRAKAINEARTATITDSQKEQQTYGNLVDIVKKELPEGATEADIAAAVADRVAKSGRYGSNSFEANVVRADDTAALNAETSKGDSLWRRLAAQDGPNYVFGGAPKVKVDDTSNVGMYKSNDETLGNRVRNFFNLDTYTVYNPEQGDPRVNRNAPRYTVAPSFFGNTEDDKKLEALNRIIDANKRSKAFKPEQSIK